MPLRERTRRRSLVIAVVTLAVPALCAVVLLSLAGGGRRPAARSSTAGTAPVQRRDLVVRDDQDGTLGYSGSGTVYDRLGGTITWLPAAGRLIRRGHPLFDVDGAPVVLLYGSQPAYRRLALGAPDGEDVRQLEENLAALGYDPGGEMAVDGHFADTTAAAVKRWQRALGLRATGAVGLGRVVFEPGARRVGQVRATLGSTAGGGGGGGRGGGSDAAATQVMSTTSTRRMVTVKLDATKQAEAEVGAGVTVKLPDESTVHGRITAVGKVAQAASGGGGGGGGGDQGNPTIPVSIVLTGRARVPTLDQAPVSVGFAQERRRHALSVPVTALLATAGGTYAVEVVDGARRRRIPVTPGTFANGYVEISGPGIAAGQRVASAQ